MGSSIIIPESEYTLVATRSSGPGGQHVNKVATAIVLKFDIPASSLPEKIKQRLLALHDTRITESGVLVIRADIYRSQLRNKEEALRRLYELVEQASKPRKKRVPTKPSQIAVEKRLKEKAQRSEIKTQRKKPI
jgi:ribosome-associated protein